MIRLLLLLLLLILACWPLATVADSASVRVSASLASVLVVEADDACARATSNEPDAIALFDGQPLTVDGTWSCRLTYYADLRPIRR